MTIDVITALATTIGIAVAFSLAMIAAGALTGRGKTRPARVVIPTDRPDRPADARELVLR
jgi:ABC-type phosphate/phosphonate transport system permease subunit